MNLSPQWLDQLRGRLTLSSIIGRSVRVEKAGREFKACCPFHNENTPSFTINDVKGFYHCFGCGAHGDAIRWMTDHRGLGFMDAVKELASEAGMDVPAPDPKAKKRAEKRDSLYDVCAAAQDWFAQNLQGVEGAHARDYLAKRGISEDIQTKFGFGFAPDGRGNIAKALDGFPADKLIEAGLLISVDGKAPYDRFRGRLMIPIRDARGRTIAWGGRILGAKERQEREPKYLNSPDTPLFDKGRTLYNIDNAAAASRQTGRLIVVEGYMDAIALAQAGFEDVVAPLGTALTEEQIGMAWKMADHPILCLDGDNAGQKAAMRAAQRALPIVFAGHSLAFASLPQGLDPDDLLQQSGPTALERVLSDSVSLVDRIWQYELAQSDLSTPESKAALKAALMGHVQTIADRDIAGFYRSELMDRFYSVVRSKSNSSQSTSRSTNFTKSFSAKGKWQSGKSSAPLQVSKDQKNLGVVEAVLSGFLRIPKALSLHGEALCALDCQNEELSRLRNYLLEYLAQGQPLDRDHLLSILRDEGFGEVSSRLLRADGLHFSFSRDNDIGDSEQEQLDQAQRDLQEVLQIAVAQPRITASLRRVSAKLDNEPSDEAFMEFAKLQEQRRNFSQRISDLAERARAR